MKISTRTRCSVLAVAFVPWLLVWIFTYAFPAADGWSPFQLSVKFIGPVWVLVSPLVTFLTVHVMLKDAGDDQGLR